MKPIQSFSLFLALLLGFSAFSGTASEAEATSSNSVRALVRLDDDPPEVDCEELCLQLAAAREVLRDALNAFLNHELTIPPLAMTLSDAETVRAQATRSLTTAQLAADDACAQDPFGTACQSALDAVNTAMGVLADAEAAVDIAKAAHDAAKRVLATLKTAVDDALADVRRLEGLIAENCPEGCGS